MYIYIYIHTYIHTHIELVCFACLLGALLEVLAPAPQRQQRRVAHAVDPHPGHLLPQETAQQHLGREVGLDLAAEGAVELRQGLAHVAQQRAVADDLPRQHRAEAVPSRRDLRDVNGGEVLRARQVLPQHLHPGEVLNDV